MFTGNIHNTLILIISIGFTGLFHSAWTEVYSRGSTEEESYLHFTDTKTHNKVHEDNYNTYYQNQEHPTITDICISNVNLEGFCLSREECVQREGQIGNLCNTNIESYCCTFLKSCGDISEEKITYFHSPDYPSRSSGTLACDYDITVQDSTCAARIEYEKVNLARKLGGLCDIDQIFILNSLDGPTTGQCGPLTGYATTVAVEPNQNRPLKLVLLVQNEANYYWFIKVTQLPCSSMTFEEPTSCGNRREPDLSSDSNDIIPVVSNPLSTILLWWNKIKPKSETRTWWNYPEPIFNTYYYESTKRHMQHGNQNKINRNINEAQRRIISGTDSNIGEFPWMVAVRNKKKFFCGGALINTDFVLTAAHCFMIRDTPIDSLVVHLGDHDLSSENETSHITRRVQRLFFHSHFHAVLLSNDIALLQLDKPVSFTEHIQPICLPTTDESFNRRIATVTGWGVSSVTHDSPTPILQKVDVKVLSNKQCSTEIGDPIGYGMLCASATSLGGTCFGDSGGPLIIEENHKSILIGVVSFGVTGCAIIPEFPDLYTRVSEYIDWININTI